MKNGQWVYSFTGEDYETEFFDTEKEILDYIFSDNFDEVTTDGVYIAQIIVHESNIDKSTVETIIEDLKNDAYQEGGEYAESFLEDVTDKQQEELVELLNPIYQKWAEKHNHKPNFFTVENDKYISLDDYT